MGYTRDSIEKVEQYLKELDKPLLIVLPSFFQKYKCPHDCGGCCGKFSKDFLEKEFYQFAKLYPEQASLFEKRQTDNELTVYTFQEKVDSTNTKREICEFFAKGRCSIHRLNPFSCSFELNKVRQLEQVNLVQDYTNLGKAFYRDLSMTTYEGKPLKCYFEEYSEEGKQEDLEVLQRLQEYYLQSRKRLCRNLSRFIEYLKKTPVEALDFNNRLCFFEGRIMDFEGLKK
jgi:hypothetical protein